MSNYPAGVTNSMIERQCLADDEVQCFDCDRIFENPVTKDCPDGHWRCGDCRITWEEGQEPCPYCGEIGGSSVTIHSREFQGDEAHGGYVESSDEACTLCQGRPS